jgi:hypothetical protein
MDIYWLTGQFTKPISKKQLEIVKKDHDYSLHYAEQVLKARWPEAEAFVLDSVKAGHIEHYHSFSQRISDYCENVIKGRWAELEQTIIESGASTLAVFYARDVIKNRWKEAEELIAKEPKCAATYAMEVLEERFEAAEDEIKNCPVSAVSYAENVLKARWPEAEETILNDNRAALSYCATVIKGPWTELEERLLCNVHSCLEYVEMTKKRWPALEKRLIKLKSPQKIIRYLNTVGKIGEELHNKMILLSFQDQYKKRVEEYFNLIEQRKKRYRKFIDKMSKWVKTHKGKTVEEVLDIMEKEEYQWVE